MREQYNSLTEKEGNVNKEIERGFFSFKMKTTLHEGVEIKYSEKSTCGREKEVNRLLFSFTPIQFPLKLKRRFHQCLPFIPCLLSSPAPPPLTSCISCHSYFINISVLRIPISLALLPASLLWLAGSHNIKMIQRRADNNN